MSKIGKDRCLPSMREVLGSSPGTKEGVGKNMERLEIQSLCRKDILLLLQRILVQFQGPVHNGL